MPKSLPKKKARRPRPKKKAKRKIARKKVTKKKVAVGVSTTQVERRSGGESTTNEEWQDLSLWEVPADQPHAEVEIGGGVTRNVGEHNFVKANVTIRRPCANDSQTIDRVSDAIAQEISERIEAELESLGGN